MNAFITELKEVIADLSYSQVKGTKYAAARSADVYLIGKLAHQGINVISFKAESTLTATQTKLSAVRSVRELNQVRKEVADMLNGLLVELELEIIESDLVAEWKDLDLVDNHGVTVATVGIIGGHTDDPHYFAKCFKAGGEIEKGLLLTQDIQLAMVEAQNMARSYYNSVAAEAQKVLPEAKTDSDLILEALASGEPMRALEIQKVTGLTAWYFGHEIGLLLDADKVKSVAYNVYQLPEPETSETDSAFNTLLDNLNDFQERVEGYLERKGGLVPIFQVAANTGLTQEQVLEGAVISERITIKGEYVVIEGVGSGWDSNLSLTVATVDTPVLPTATAHINLGLPMETPIMTSLPFTNEENEESGYSLEDNLYSVTGLDRNTGKPATYNNARFRWSLDGKRPLVFVGGHCVSHCLLNITSFELMPDVSLLCQLEAEQQGMAWIGSDLVCKKTNEVKATVTQKPTCFERTITKGGETIHLIAAALEHGLTHARRATLRAVCVESEGIAATLSA